jgi:hypothetical protein
MPDQCHNRVRARRSAALVVLALVFAPAGHAQVYKCTVGGATVYQDAACGTARQKLPKTPAATPGPVAAEPARRSAASDTPEFAPGTVIAPSRSRSRSPAPLRPVVVAAPAALEQTPYIAKPPTRPTGTAQEQLQRAVAEQQAMHAQRGVEMQALSDRWRSNPGEMDMSADMAALDRRWRPGEEAIEARIRALSDAVFRR